jgi:hypothetical protein
MGVYISGLEMPQDGRITLQIDSTGGVYVVNKFKIISEKYEESMIATEIQPHGRLIDKDKLRRELFVNFNGERIPFYDCDNFPTKIAYRDLHSILAEQKTVIKAED